MVLLPCRMMLAGAGESQISNQECWIHPRPLAGEPEHQKAFSRPSPPLPSSVTENLQCSWLCWPSTPIPRFPRTCILPPKGKGTLWWSSVAFFFP